MFDNMISKTEISVLVANGALASSRWQEKKSPAMVKINKFFHIRLVLGLRDKGRK